MITQDAASGNALNVRDSGNSAYSGTGDGSLFWLFMDNASDSGTAESIRNQGSGIGLDITANGVGLGERIVQSVNSASAVTALSVLSSNAGAGAAYAANFASGNVGIARPTPSYPLDVTGSGHFTSYVDADHFVATSTSNASTFGSKVGIGTTTPGTTLGVQGNSFFAGRVDSTSTISSTNLTVNLATNQVAQLNDNASASGFWGTSLGFLSQGGLAEITTNGQALTFNVSGTRNSMTVGTEVGRFSLTGNFGVGTTSPDGKLAVQYNYGNSFSNFFVVGSSTNSSNSTYATLFDVDKNGSTTIGLFGACAGANALQTSATGLIQCGAVSSDERLKKDIQPMDDVLADIMQLRPVNYFWKPDANMGDQEESGFIAQEVAEVFPDAAERMQPGPLTPDGTLEIKEPNLVAYAIKAIQELAAQKGTDNTARLDAQEAQIRALKMHIYILYSLFGALAVCFVIFVIRRKPSMSDDTTYSNRELDAKFAAVEQVSNDNRHSINNKLQNLQSVLEPRLADLSKNTADSLSRLEIQADSIETQTKKTNGRVSKLENWQAYVIGFCGAITILMLPIIFLTIQKFLGV